MANIHIRIAHASEKYYLEDLQRRASLNNQDDREVLLANPDGIIETRFCAGLLMKNNL